MKRLGALLVGCSLVALAPSAGAEEKDARRAILDPDSTIAVEMRFGPYRPNVDSEPGLTGSPYQDMFGSSRRYMISAEVDWEFFHLAHVGSIGLGGWAGYTSASANAIFTSGSPDQIGQRSAESVSLTIRALAALLVVRLDVLARETKIPLVPYGKFGLGTALWSSENGIGTSVYPHDTGKLGRGHTNGLVYAGGVMFLLDALDRQTAKTFQNQQGVNHTYLFAEWTVTGFTGLGQSGAMRVGDSTWNLGFAFEM
jgi:hypothetical protein